MMPGMFGGGQNAQPKQPFGPQLKQALITAAPMFNAMAAGYASGRGPYAYMDQGAAGVQAMLKQKRDEEAEAAHREATTAHLLILALCLAWMPCRSLPRHRAVTAWERKSRSTFPMK
jgi:hypothetical protein